MSRILVIGSGPLGLFATAVASWFNPQSLVVVGAPAARLDLARQWGASATVDIAAHPDPAERAALVRELTGGGPNIVFEMAGSRTAFVEGLAMAGRNARYIVVGSLGPDPQPVVPAGIVGRGLQITGCLSGDIATYHKAMRFLERGAARFDWSQMFSGTSYGLHNATGALHSLAQMQEMKPVLRPWAAA